MRIQPTLEGGKRMLQKQFARSIEAIQGEAEERCWRRMVPISRRVGRRNFGGGNGQLEFSARIDDEGSFVLVFGFDKDFSIG